MPDDEKRLQVLNQCRVVKALAETIAGIRNDYMTLLSDPNCNLPLDVVGNMTAMQMETLGDILNGMDANTEEDEWMTPIFRKAHEMFPQRDS